MGKLTIAGNLEDSDFQQAKFIGTELCAAFPDKLQLEVIDLIESEWLVFVEERTKELQVLEHGPFTLVTHSTAGYIGGVVQLLEWAKTQFNFVPSATKATVFERLAQDDFKQFISKSKNTFCRIEFDFADSKETDNRELVVELFSDALPKTSGNFIALFDKYKGTAIHRVVKDGWIQGGDIEDSCGSHSISAANDLFVDESYIFKHDRMGILSMANQGRHTNGSQFFITLRALPSFDGQYVVFGRVVKGTATLKRISKCAVTFAQRPASEITISHISLV